jgi:hypothetical protein
MKRLLLLGFALAATQAFAADPTPPACADAKFRALDFWVGEWDLTWKGGGGANHITKSYEGCVIEEHFDGQPSQHLQGHSISLYDIKSSQWRQMWVDNEGEIYDLAGGPQADGTFALTELHAQAKEPRYRMVFENIKPDSFDWHWQDLKDGKTWTDSWVIHYARKKAA